MSVYGKGRFGFDLLPRDEVIHAPASRYERERDRERERLKSPSRALSSRSNFIPTFINCVTNSNKLLLGNENYFTKGPYK